jgi:hypothetical protein
MYTFDLLYSIVLFFLLTPGLLVTLPSRLQNKIVIAMVHAILFGVLYYLSKDFFYNLFVFGVVKNPFKSF